MSSDDDAILICSDLNSRIRGLLDVIYDIDVLRSRRNKKQIQEIKICYLDSQQKALLRFNKIY